MFFNDFTTKPSLKCTEHICTFSLADAQRPDNIFAAQQIMPRYIRLRMNFFIYVTQPGGGSLRGLVKAQALPECH